MARRYIRDKRGRFAASAGALRAGVTYGNLGDLKSDQRHFNRKIKAADKKIAGLRAQIQAKQAQLAGGGRVEAQKSVAAARKKADAAQKKAVAARAKADAMKAKTAAMIKERAAKFGLTEAQYMAKFGPKKRR